VTAIVLVAAVLAATVLSQGRVRLALAGMVLPGLLVAASFEMPLGVGEAIVALTFAVGTGAAWAGVIPAPVAVQFSTAIGSGFSVGIILFVSRLVSRADAAAAALTFATLFYVLELFGSRSNPFGEWGSLAHSQTRQGWALAVARHGPHAVTFVLALVSGSVGYAASNSSLTPLAIAAISALATVTITVFWHRSSPPEHSASQVVGLLEEDERLFAIYAGGFVNGTLDEEEWSAFDEQSTTSLNSLLRQTVDHASNGSQIVVWGEGAGLVSADRFKEAVAQAQTAVRSAPCILVASWAVLDRVDGLMSNITTTITGDGEIASSISKQHPVPGPEVERTRSVESQRAVVDTELGRLGVAICFDADHHTTWKQFADDRIDIVAIPASDWPVIGHLHADMARLRSRSIGTSIIRPARGGVSKIIDSHGRVTAQVDHRHANNPPLRVNEGNSTRSKRRS